MMKDRLAESQAVELIKWWHQIDHHDSRTRKLWLEVYDQHNLSGLQPETRARLELIAQVNRRTMPEKVEEEKKEEEGEYE